MSHQKHRIFQLFLSVIELEEEVVSSSELVKRVETQRADLLIRDEWSKLFRHEGLCVWARRFCQRYGNKPEEGETEEGEQEFNTDEEKEAAEEIKALKMAESITGYIDDQYLLGFIELRPWEKTIAKKFGLKRAWLPSEKGHKEVCRMTAQERVEAGNSGIKTGRDTVARYQVLRRWGLRGGGQDNGEETAE